MVDRQPGAFDVDDDAPLHELIVLRSCLNKKAAH